jgi:hypothetical protein
MRSGLFVILLSVFSSSAFAVNGGACGGENGPLGSREPIDDLGRMRGMARAALNDHSKDVSWLRGAFDGLLAEYAESLAGNKPLDIEEHGNRETEKILRDLALASARAQGVSILADEISELSINMGEKTDLQKLANRLLLDHAITMNFDIQLEVKFHLGLRDRTEEFDSHGTVYIPTNIFFDMNGEAGQKYFRQLSNSFADYGVKGISNFIFGQQREAYVKPAQPLAKPRYAGPLDFESKEPFRNPQTVTGVVAEAYKYFGLEPSATYNDLSNAYLKKSNAIIVRRRLAYMKRDWKVVDEIKTQSAELDLNYRLAAKN